MKSIIITLAILCYCFSIQAQNNKETVYLKNGSIVHGIIVEQVPNESLKIRTNDGNLFVFQMDEITKITRTDTHLNTKMSSSELVQNGFRRNSISLYIPFYAIL